VKPPSTNVQPSGDILRLTDVPDWQRRISELDPIFFDASLTKSFIDDAARAAFRDRWLARFIANWPELAHVAIAADGSLIGYIVGAHHDPARDERFADVGFYPHLGNLTPRYPAHLHINLAANARNLGVGSRLIRAFEDDVRMSGLSGLHLVTGRDSRNRPFYTRNRFVPVAELIWGGTPIVMLAKSVIDETAAHSGQ